MLEKTLLPTKQVESARKKREAILLAARDIFGRQGYEETTIAEIASAAGIAVGTVYLYFHNKREIYIETSLIGAQEITAVLNDPQILALPLVRIPRAIVERVFQLNQTKSAFSSLLQIDIQNPQELAIKQRGMHTITESIDAFLRYFVDKGDFIPFDTEIYANLLFNMVNSAIYDCFCLELGANEERYRECMIELLERLFFGSPLSPKVYPPNQENTN